MSSIFVVCICMVFMWFNLELKWELGVQFISLEISSIILTDFQRIHKVFPNYAQTIPRVCILRVFLMYSQNIPKYFPRYIQSIPKVFKKYSKSILGVFPMYSVCIPKVCLPPISPKNIKKTHSKNTQETKYEAHQFEFF